MEARAVVFLRRSGADGIGHVGWAFDNGDRTFTAGSVENPHHSLRTNPRDMGFWAVRSRDPILPMRARNYHEFKLLVVGQGDPEYALRVVKWISRQPYEIVGHNCMDATYDVLRAFDVERLPAPAHHWEPNHWFDRVQGEHFRIEADDVRLEPAGRAAAAPGRLEPDVESLFGRDADTVAPARPAWRTPNTPEWRDFQSALAEAALVPGSSPTADIPAQQSLLVKIRHLLGFA